KVSRRVWALRLRRTEHGLALSPLFILPSAHVNRVGIRVVSFRSSIAHPAYPLSTLHCVPHGSSARLEAERLAGVKECKRLISTVKKLTSPTAHRYDCYCGIAVSRTR